MENLKEQCDFCKNEGYVACCNVAEVNCKNYKREKKVICKKEYRCIKHKTHFTYLFYDDDSQEVIEGRGHNCLSHRLEPLTGTYYKDDFQYEK